MITSIFTYLLLHSIYKAHGGYVCEKGHLLSEGRHHIREPNCEVTILPEEGSNCLPVLECYRYLDTDCEPEEELEVSDGLGGKEIFCNSFKIHSSSGSDYLFLKSRGNPPVCFVTCLYSGSVDHDSRPLEITQKRKFSNKCECGHKSREISSTRVVYGENTEPLEYPWFTQQIIQKPDYGYFVPSCGGSIINDRTILTAAHCGYELVDTLIGYYELWSKVHNYTEIGKDQYSEKLTVKKVIAHPLYEEGNDRFDMAILQLAEPINFLKDQGLTGTVCLDQDRGRSWEGEIGEIIGRGFTETVPISDVLKRGKQLIEATEVCDVNSLGRNISDKFLCTTKSPGWACWGDSGGPFSKETRPDRWTQLGVTSFGNCTLGDTIFIKVSEFIPWIFHHSSEGTWCQE